MGWRKAEKEEGKERRRKRGKAGTWHVQKGNARPQVPCSAAIPDRLPTPNLTPLGTVQVSSEREAGAKKQSGVAGVSGEFSGPRSTGDGELRTPMGHKEPRQETVVRRPEASASRHVYKGPTMCQTPLWALEL